VTEIGFVFNVLDPSGIRVHGKIGGKKGKTMKNGESLYFCDFLVRSGRDYRKPAWIRARSLQPSKMEGDYKREAKLKIGYISLFQDGKVESLTDYQGTAVRTIVIEPITVTSRAKKDSKSKSKEEKLTEKKKVTADLTIEFDVVPTILP